MDFQGVEPGPIMFVADEPETERDMISVTEVIEAEPVVPGIEAEPVTAIAVGIEDLLPTGSLLDSVEVRQRESLSSHTPAQGSEPVETDLE
jgi:hypothetical protein